MKLIELVKQLNLMVKNYLMVTAGSVTTVAAVPGTAAASIATATSTQSTGTSGNVTITDGTTCTGGNCDMDSLLLPMAQPLRLDKGDGNAASTLTFTANKATVDGIADDPANNT